MNTTTKLLLFGAAAVLLMTGSPSYIDALKNFIPLVEGFSPIAKWDYKQWSWGYGTAAGFDQNRQPTGTISKSKAMQDTLTVMRTIYSQVSPMLTVKLSGNQCAALLSLLYNLGTGRASTFIPFINAHDYAGLYAKMRAYVYAGGVRNQGLVNRREKEIALFSGVAQSGRYMVSMPVFEERIAPELITDEAGN